MVDMINDGEVNDEYLITLKILSKKLKFVEESLMVNSAKALKDVQPELEKLRKKAVDKVVEIIVQKLNALRVPRTNIQIIQQNVLKYKYAITFLKEHGNKAYNDLLGHYINTMNKALTARFCDDIQRIDKLQLDSATSSDLIGVETIEREPLTNLEERIKILEELEESALNLHISEITSTKYSYEVLFRTLCKLLIDTATSEYHFCDDFFCGESLLDKILAGPFSVIKVHIDSMLKNCYDALGLTLMIHIVHQYQMIQPSNLAIRLNIRCLDEFLVEVRRNLLTYLNTVVLELYLNSLHNANVETLWKNDVHPHNVMRRFAELTAPLIHLNRQYGDMRLQLKLESLTKAVDALLKYFQYRNCNLCF